MPLRIGLTASNPITSGVPTKTVSWSSTAASLSNTSPGCRTSLSVPARAGSLPPPPSACPPYPRFARPLLQEERDGQESPFRIRARKNGSVSLSCGNILRHRPRPQGTTRVPIRVSPGRILSPGSSASCDLCLRLPRQQMRHHRLILLGRNRARRVDHHAAGLEREIPGQYQPPLNRRESLDRVPLTNGPTPEPTCLMVPSEEHGASTKHTVTGARHGPSQTHRRPSDTRLHSNTRHGRCCQ